MTSSSTKLNAEQQQAVDHIKGPCLVTAVPGSGKTSTLTARVVSLVESGVDSRNICCVTFTNKAAKEMKDRITLADPGNHTWISTFHQLCLRLIHNHGSGVGLKDGFSIWDQEDSNAVMNRVHGMWLASQNHPDDFDSKLTPGERSQLFEALDSLRESGKSFNLEHEDSRIQMYVKELVDANAVDFSGMLYLGWRILTKYPEKAKKLSQRYQFVLVDEAQDMNDVQYAIAKILVSEHGNLFMVGDYQQSIFSWRGAKPENILNFKKDFPAAVTITLPKNYRSKSEILQTAENLIWKNKDAADVTLVSERGSGGKVTAGQYETDREEALDIVERIMKYKNGGYEWSDIAVIYRLNNLSQVFETVLANQNVPYVVKGGMSFFARKEIKTALSYMKLLINPSDSNAFKRAISNPKRGVGDVLMGKIDNLAKERGIPVTEAACIIKPSGKQTRAKLYEFEKLMDKYRAKLEAGESLGTIGDELIKESGYRAQLKQEADEKRDTKPGLANCEVNIDTLFGGIEQYEEEDKNPSLVNYLQQIALIQEGDNKKLKNAVNLLTMHSAKGLEWPCVFVIGCSAATIPYPKSVEEGRENEERRLFYVALTRAKDRLRVTFHEWSPRNKSRYHDPSPYFWDMTDRPEDKNAVQ
jgi:DNA helicase-2/ATP-dependent DNA helicase PcrA